MMPSKSLLIPDSTNVIFLSNIVEYFGHFNQAMKQFLEETQEEDASVSLMDDYFPFKYDSIDDLLDHFDELNYLREEIKNEFDDN